MRIRSTGVQILVETGERSAERPDSAVAPFLRGEPFDSVETVLSLTPGFIAKRVPVPFRCIPSPGVLHRHYVTVRGQECGRPNTYHDRLVFAVGSAFEQNRKSTRLRRQI